MPPAPPPMAAFGAGHLSVGSLSKTSWGGLRIGWVRGEADVVRGLTAVAVRSSMAGPVVEQGDVWRVFGSPRHEVTRTLLAPLQARLPAALQARLPKVWLQPRGPLW